MALKPILLLLACLHACFQLAQCGGTYVIVAPAQVRPGMVYSLSVNLLQEAARVTASMVRASDNVTVASATRQAPRGVTNINLQMPSQMQNGGYQLKVTGLGGQTFSNSTPVTFSSKAMSIFVQTDKAIYKPGQTVNFRVLAVYPNLTVYTGDFDVDVHDGNGNKIKQWKGVRGERGVVTHLLELSSQPVLGDWTVKVTAGTEKAEKSFTVAEYVLPQFEVTVQLPSYVLESADSFPVTVKAKYTYGKPVAGPVTLNVTMENGWNSGAVTFIQQTAQLDSQGEATMTVLKADLLRITSYLSYQAFRVTAVVTESLTGNSQNGTATVTFYPQGYTVEFHPSNPDTFKPGLDYTGVVKVAQPDGLPVTSSSGRTVLITATATLETRKSTTRAPLTKSTTPLAGDLAARRIWMPPYEPPVTRELPAQNVTLDDSGMAEFRVTVPADAVSVSLQARYQEVDGYGSLSKSYSPSNNYIQLYLKSNSVLKKGGNAVFEVKSTERITALSYQVLARGSIVSSGKVSLNGQARIRTFYLDLTSDMAPNARIVCYYVRGDSEIVADSLSFDVQGVFRNNVSVSVSKAEAQPAQTVDVTVQASPQSTAFILAVDQSVLLLKSGNDITQNQVIEDIKTYDTRADDVFPIWGGPVPFRGKRSIMFPIYYGGSDASKIFQKAGVKVMTDAIVFQYIPPPRKIFPWERFGGFAGGDMALAFARPAMAESVPAPAPPSINEANLAQVERVRTLFPETWLWTNVSVGASGYGNVSTTVPDTITSWIVSAFAVGRNSGLGVAPTTAKLKVFRPFFVNLNLPYSVTRGEQVVIQAIVFNYLDTPQDVRVTMPSSQNFQNILILASGEEQLVNANQTMDIRVPAGEGKSVYFPIVPTKLGFIDIEVSARSSVAADALRKNLLVKAEGVAKEMSVSVLVDLKKSSSFSQIVPVVALPPNLVPDSTRARITAIGDLMGPTVNGLESLLQMPTGCGEQNMLGLAPDVFVTSYLKATNQLSADIADKAIRFMEDGYQRELTYQHSDGSFSAFGNSDDSGSMWLTAFVVKTFEQAKPYIFIDVDVITRAVKWIVDRQNSDNGSFPEPGRVIHTEMQGGSSSGDSLTAYVLISLLELKDLPAGVNQSVTLATKKAADYLKQRLPQISDDYVLALTTYALTLARDPAANASFASLLTRAVVKDGLRYWHKPTTETTSSTALWRSPQAAASDVEMTAYVLMTYAARDDFTGGLDVMKWIALQRNPHGGYASTQDTVLALQALSQYARLAFSRTFNMAVSVTAGDVSTQFTINQGNALVLQSAELPSVPSVLAVNATGSGIGLITLNVFFNVKNEVEKPTFAVNVSLLRDEINLLRIHTCVSWLADGTSGMAVQEVGIPSGFTVDDSSIVKHKLLKRTELEDKKLVLYFDEIGTEPVCTTLDATRTGLVAKSQPVPVRVYDYYRPENQATTFYKSAVLESSSVCDVCVECQCPKRK